ncbi:unnamed protein product [Pieris macdunnoughi]|uniref:Uncharacterized protein n=1 Tax=Pieris macdunnoughi TaxID=345717 RepID=A0A821QIR9_9NEOP|nr:unnamed protein product [Pieris macdunnoughi]
MPYYGYREGSDSSGGCSESDGGESDSEGGDKYREYGGPGATLSWVYPGCTSVSDAGHQAEELVSQADYQSISFLI